MPLPGGNAAVVDPSFVAAAKLCRHPRLDNRDGNIVRCITVTAEEA